MADIFITSALPYVNNELHLGNFTGSLLPADIISRYNRIIGNNVCYVCGTDDYGTATMVKSKAMKIGASELCDIYRKAHSNICSWFNIDFDVWGQTSTSTHTKFVHKIFKQLYMNGYIDIRSVDQLYCTECQYFLADRYVVGQCYHEQCSHLRSMARGDQCDTCGQLIDALQLISPVCTLCNGNSIKIKASDHLFLLLDKLQSDISDYVTHANFDKHVLAISKAWLKSGLKPRCITRDIEWGTPIPYDFDVKLESLHNKTFYVWFDAPIAYYSIYAHAKSDWETYFANPNLKWISTQGKDNIPFHTIIFSGTMIGTKSNDLPLINEIANSHYLMYEGKKFSKTNDVGIFGNQIINISNKLNIHSDYWRYYLMYIRPEHTDSNFSMQEFSQIIKSDLISNFGNMVNRCVSIISKSNLNTINICPPSTILNQFFQYENIYKNFMTNYKLSAALKFCMKLSTDLNKYIQDEKAWSITDDVKLKQTIGIIVYQLLFVTKLLSPFIPITCSTITSSFDTTDELNVKLIRKILLLFKAPNVDELNAAVESSKIV